MAVSLSLWVGVDQFPRVNGVLLLNYSYIESPLPILNPFLSTMYQRLLLTSLLSLVLSGLSAQMYYDDGRLIYSGDSTVQGNYQALGINPANLGRANSFRTSAGFLQFGGNFHSEGLNLTQLLALSFSNQSFDSSLRNTLLSQNSDPSEQFGYEANFDMNWAAFSVASPRLGGIAVNVQDRLASTSEIPNPFFGVLLQGDKAPVFDSISNPNDLPGIGDGTYISYSHIRALRVGYGRKLIDIDEIMTLYAGATFQYLWGIGYYQADVVEGRFASIASFSEAYRVNYGTVNIQNPNDQRRLLSSAGNGVAIDLGLSLDIGEKLNVGAAVIDMGGITWEKDIVEAEADFEALLDSVKDGLINSYEISQEVGNLNDIVAERPGESFRTSLNSHLRLNASYRVLPRMVLGADLVVPFRNADARTVDQDAGVLTTTLSWAIVPKVVNFGTGVVYSPSFGYRWPAGVVIGLGQTAISITTADCLTFLTARDPLASLSIAFITGFH